MPSEYIVDKTNRYVRLKWRRDAGEPGYVQIATGAPGTVDEFVDLDERSIDKLIKGLQKAKNQAFGDTHRVVTVDDLRNAGLVQADINRIWQQGFRPGGPVSSGDAVVLDPAPEVTVESDATASSRLDVEGYRATRRGDR